MSLLPPGRRPRKAIFLIVLFPPALIFLIGLFWVNSVADRRWTMMEARTQELLESWEHRDCTRKVLRGDPLEGNAWDDYHQAQSKVKGYIPWPNKRRLPGDPSLWDIFRQFRQDSSKADLDVVTRALADLNPALAEFRRGVQRREACCLRRWPSDPMDIVPPVTVTVGLAELAVTAARRSMVESRIREAIECQLDVARYGQDIAADQVALTQAIGFGVMRLALAEFQETLVSGRLGTADLEEAERELEILERTMPRPNSLVQERIYLGLRLREMDSWDIAESAGKLDWHHLYSPRLVMGDITGDLDRSAKRIDEATLRGRKQLKQEIERLESEERATNSKLSYSSTVKGSIQSSMDACTRLRLLRIGAHWKRTGETLELPDPFGGNIHYAHSEQGMKIWSEGPNEVDDNGAGDWNAGPDIVLIIRK